MPRTRLAFCVHRMLGALSDVRCIDRVDRVDVFTLGFLFLFLFFYLYC